jgi:hypothetical protein
MRPTVLWPVLLSAALLAPACTFVKMAPGADEVSVVALGRALPGCEKRGAVEVSVKDRLGPYERDHLRVRDELETLARNEAPSLAADTIQPEAPPNDGVQRFVAYRCAGAAPLSPQAPAEPRDRAQTEPLRDD